MDWLSGTNGHAKLSLYEVVDVVHCGAATCKDNSSMKAVEEILVLKCLAYDSH